ncbi:MAG TPA: GAF domain-containing protein, partial [bacterium]|nr:GAF domain-containing protein [bacterium]
DLRGANDELIQHRRRLKEEVYQTNRLLQQRVVELSTLYEIGKTLVAELDLPRLLKQTVERVSSLLGAVKTSLMIYDKDTRHLHIEVAHGFDEGDFPLAVPLGTEPSGYCALTRQPLLVENIDLDGRFRGSIAPSYLGRSFICVPLVARNELIGVLNIADKTNGQSFIQQELDFVVTLASQAAIAIDNATLYDHVQKAYFNTVQSLMGALEKKDRYTMGHSERVTRYCKILADHMGVKTIDSQMMVLASSLHDIGKIGISESILCKPGALTDEEYMIIKQHPVMGEQILRPLDFLGEGIQMVRHHHEREDGAGYPDGIAKQDLTLPMRILIAADAFDAMTSIRPYRRSLSLNQAISELQKHKGSQFDPSVSDCFVDLLHEKADEIVPECKMEQVVN